MTNLHGARSTQGSRRRSHMTRRTPGRTRSKGKAARPPRGARWSCSWSCARGRGGLLRTQNKRRSPEVSERVLYHVTRTTVCSPNGCRAVGNGLGIWFYMSVNRASVIFRVWWFSWRWLMPHAISTLADECYLGGNSETEMLPSATNNTKTSSNL